MSELFVKHHHCPYIIVRLVLEILISIFLISFFLIHSWYAVSYYLWSPNFHFRLLASDTDGVINIWDRRVSDLPCLELTTNSTGLLNSIKLSGDNEVGFN